LEYWPAFDFQQIDNLVRAGFSLGDLYEQSSTLPDEDPGADWFVDSYFWNPLICTGTSAWQFWTAERESFRGKLSDLSFIVPGTMSALNRETAEGKPSAHTKGKYRSQKVSGGSNAISLIQRHGQGNRWAPYIRKWRAAGISVADACAAILRHLSDRGHLYLSSFGRQITAWLVCVRDVDESVLHRFMRIARRFGADLATFVIARSSSDFQPGAGTTDPQTVFYFSPENIDG